MKKNMMRLAFILILLGFIGLLGINLLPERLQIYGPLQVGKPMPLSARSIFEQDSKNISSGSLYYYLPQSTEKDCECSHAERAVKNAGNKMEIIDSKISKYFGVPTVHNGVTFQLADSLLIVVNKNGQIQSIYRNVNQIHLIMGIGTEGPLVNILETLVYRRNQAISASAEIDTVLGPLFAKLETKF